MKRLDVCFPSNGDACAAWLYLPDREPPHPCVVMAHGLGGIKEAGLEAFAERFTAAGLSCLVFDYRHFGQSGGEPRQLLEIARQRADWRAAIGYARSRADLDEKRIALWGTSFAGGHVIEAAAGDERIAAVVAQVPLVDGGAGVRAVPARQSLRLMAAAARDELRRLRHRAPFLVDIAGVPGALAMVTTPDALEGQRVLAPADVAWPEKVAARIVPRIGLWRPGRQAAKLGCPLLVCVCEDDTITPPSPAITAARRAPAGELRSYPGGHYAIYAGAVFEQAVADQVAFLTHHLEAR